MKLVVGLGNPGSRYAGTRHNVGFMVIDLLAKSAAGRWQQRFDAELMEWHEGNEKILLMKPHTFMNRSGRAVRQAMDFYQIELGDLLSVCDDINLPLGKLRIRSKGSAGGHNGLKDIQNHLGTNEYSRLRIGVGAPEGEDAADFVLDRFRPDEKKVIDSAIIHAAEAVSAWLKLGIEECMNRYNG